MAAIKYRWNVDELTNVMTLFDVQKVYRSTTSDPFNWIELTSIATRIPLVAGQTDYLYDDVAGDPSYYYASAYYNSSTTDESALSDPVRGDLAGYLSIQDVRDEGFNDPPYDDARVAYAIEMATRVIDSVTGQWFEARQRVLQLDVPNPTREFLLSVPVILVSAATFWDDTIDLEDLWVYNRHLTQGLPDDLQDPKVVFKEDYETFRMRKVTGGRQRFTRSNRRLELTGYFGYTELALGDTPGETAADSQIPLSYGAIPAEIKRAALLLVQRYLPTIASGDGADAVLASRITAVKTQDQSLSLAAPSGADSSYGATGILEVDKILAAYSGPMQVGVV